MKHMRHIPYLLAVMLLCCAQAAFGQVDLKIKKQQNVQNKVEASSILSGRGAGSNAGRPAVKKISQVKADRELLYAKVVKRYGRWEGYGKPVSREYASHLECYFKLTYTGGSKYPARMQAYDGYHRLTTNHGITTYLVNPNSIDDGADSLWAEKLATVTQWDFVYNEKGDVFCERAYDADGEFVYAFYPVKAGKRTAGFFTDAYGRPAKLRKEGQAQVVYVSYDKNGFANLLEYYDFNGYRQPNKDGAYMSRMTNSPDGLVVSQGSCNIAGRWMIDIFGNSGQRIAYDANGNAVCITNVDDHQQPMRISKGNSPFYNNVVNMKQEFDRYGRLIRESFVDLDNKPDTNGVGIHSIEFRYNDRGKRVYLAYKDINGNLKENPYSDGVTHWKNDFDAKGRLTYTITYGDSAKLVRTQYRETFRKYDLKGNNISLIKLGFAGDSTSYIDYVETPQGLRPVREDEVMPKKHVQIRRFENDNEMIRIAYDEEGRQVLWEYSDLEGRPIMLYGYWRNISSFKKVSDTVVVVTDLYVDTLGRAVVRNGKDWAFEKDIRYLRNGKLAVLDAMYYNADSTYYKGWRSFFDESGVKTGESQLNQYHKVTRISNSLFYYAAVTYDLSGDNVSTIVVYDEFGNPAYVETSDKVFHFWNNVDGTTTYFDEHARPIKDMKAFCDSLPAVMSVSVLDTVGYVNGFKDGDVILRLDDMNLGMSMQHRADNDLFYFKLVTLADTTKRVTLLRHHPEEKRSEIVELTLPKGTIQDLGIFPQLIYYTEQERQRHLDVVGAYERQHHVSFSPNMEQFSGSHNVIIRKPRHTEGVYPMSTDMMPVYYNPAVVFSMAAYHLSDSAFIANEYWNWGMDVDTLVLMAELSKKDIPVYISMSTDLKKTLAGYTYQSNANLFGFVSVNDELYGRIKPLYNEFINTFGDSFNPAYRRAPVKKTDRKLRPASFFEELKKQPGIVYDANALDYVNVDSLRLPECFKGLERVMVGKATSPELYNRLKENLGMIDTTGYFILPNFYQGDIALAKREGERLFSELLVVYIGRGSIRAFYQKGCFSSDNLLAIQNYLGISGKESVYDLPSEQSLRTLYTAHTEQDGLARQANIEGYYVVIEYNDWKGLNAVTDDEVVEYLRKGKLVKKHLVLMPVCLKDDSSFSHFGQPEEFSLDKGALGMRIRDWSVSEGVYERVLSAYEKFKRQHK